MSQEEIDAEQELIRTQDKRSELILESAYEAALASDSGFPEGGLTDEDSHNVTPLDLLDSSNYTTKDIRKKRLDICNGCDRLFKPTRSCRECGCFMSLKTWLTDAECPLGKW